MVGVLSGMKSEVEDLLGFFNEAAPDSLKIQLTTAYSLTLGGYPDQAITMLENLCLKNPDSEFSACLLDFFRIMRGDDITTSKLERAELSADEALQSFAKSSLNVLRRTKKA